MGILSDLFGGKPSHERQLEEMYVRMYNEHKGMAPSQARALVRDLIRQAKEEGRQEGTDRLPPDFGDSLLAQDGTDEDVTKMLATKRKEGVRDEDIRWWWNMPDLERRLMLKDDDNTRMAQFLYELDRGKSKEEAAAAVRKHHPMYGDPSDTEHTTDDDRPLASELKDRVNRYIEKRTQQHVEQFKRDGDIEASPTFNALVRREIRRGVL